MKLILRTVFLASVAFVAYRLFVYFNPPVYNLGTVGVLAATYLLYGIGAFWVFGKIIES